MFWDKYMKKILKFTLFCFLLGILFISSFMLYFTISTKNIKFNEENLRKNMQNIEFYDSENNLINYVSGKSEYCTEIPTHVKNAFISVEDKRFYSHNGIDFKRIAKASLINIKNFSFSQGASTISQQLIKNTHLTNQKTLKRKFAEIKLTLELEKRYTKDQILSMYLNNIYFGENCYGIKNASEKYFGKLPKDLSLAEGAMLAGIIKAPSIYNPIVNYDLANKRKNLVLQLMQEKYLTNKEYQEAKNFKIVIKNQDNISDNSYLYQVENELKEILNSPYFNKKIKVYTYLNSELQDEISKIKLDVKTDKTYIVINNKNMGIQAYFSSCNNIKRQPASTIKPLLVYAPNYQEKKVNLYTKILDEQTNFNGYSPKNYNDKYHGYVSCMDALSKSLNIPSVKLLNSLGEDKLKSYAKKLNIDLEDEGLSLALGSLKKGISMQHLASCYSTFANNGDFEQAKFIKEIKNEQGKTIYKRKNNKKEVFSSETAYLINYNLMDSVKNGTSKKINGLNYEICAKTGTNGTSKGNFDAYSLSYTTAHTVGVWLGNKNNELMDNKISGATYPCLITKNIYEKLYKNTTPEAFNVPKGIVKINIDKDLYEEKFELKLANDLSNSFEGIFIDGTQPNEINTSFNNFTPIIKNIKIHCNIRDISLFYDLNNSDGVYLYENKNNPKLIKVLTNNSYKFTTSYGKHSYILIPFKIINNKTIYGEKIILPEINIQKEVPKDWWRE